MATINNQGVRVELARLVEATAKRLERAHPEELYTIAEVAINKAFDLGAKYEEFTSTGDGK